MLKQAKTMQQQVTVEQVAQALLRAEMAEMVEMLTRLTVQERLMLEMQVVLQLHTLAQGAVEAVAVRKRQLR
jgi:hypothetical protein